MTGRHAHESCPVPLQLVVVPKDPVVTSGHYNKYGVIPDFAPCEIYGSDGDFPFRVCNAIAWITTMSDSNHLFLHLKMENAENKPPEIGDYDEFLDYENAAATETNPAGAEKPGK